MGDGDPPHADRHRLMICRHGRAVACTIPDDVQGFRGYHHQWWNREAEAPFPD